MKHILLSLTVFVIVHGARRVTTNAHDLCWPLSVPPCQWKPAVIQSHHWSFFSLSLSEGLERMGIMEVFLSLPQVQPNDLKIGYCPQKNGNQVNSQSRRNVVHAMFCELKYEGLKPALVVLVDRPMQISRSSKIENFLQSCFLCVLFNRNSWFSSIIHWDCSPHLLFSLPLLILVVETCPIWTDFTYYWF